MAEEARGQSTLEGPRGRGRGGRGREENEKKSHDFRPHREKRIAKSQEFNKVSLKDFGGLHCGRMIRMRILFSRLLRVLAISTVVLAGGACGSSDKTGSPDAGATGNSRFVGIWHPTSGSVTSPATAAQPAAITAATPSIHAAQRLRPALMARCLRSHCCEVHRWFSHRLQSRWSCSSRCRP